MITASSRAIFRRWRRWISRRRRTVATIRFAHRAYWTTVLIGLIAVFGGQVVDGVAFRQVACSLETMFGGTCDEAPAAVDPSTALADASTAASDTTAAPSASEAVESSAYWWTVLGVGISVLLLRAVHGLVVASFFVPRVRRRRRADGDTRVVITFVHGTFAPDAPWTREDARLPRTLWERFGGHCSIYTLDWSGENNHYARIRAAEALQRHLSRISKLCPGIPHVLVAHSHGGNVVMYALRGHADRVAGVATLSTPFIQVRDRAPVDIAAFGTSLPLVLLACVGGFVVSWLTYTLIGSISDRVMGPWADWARVTVWAAVTILLARWWRRSSQQLKWQLTFGTIEESRCLVVRTPGDEAGAVLMMLPLASVLMHLAGKAVVTLGNAPLRLRDNLSRAYVRHRDARLRLRWLLVYMLAIGAIVVGLQSTANTASLWWRLALPALLVGTLALIARYRRQVDDVVRRMRRTQGMIALASVALITGSAFAVPGRDDADFVATVITSAIFSLFPLPVLWLLTRFAVIVGHGLQVVTATVAHFVAALAALPFGIDLLPAILHYDLTAENTPVGEWTMRSAYIPRTRSNGPGVATPGSVAAVDEPLMHSRAYSDPAVCYHVSDFVEARRDWWNSDQRTRRTAELAALVTSPPIPMDAIAGSLAAR